MDWLVHHGLDLLFVQGEQLHISHNTHNLIDCTIMRE